ncbi:hypothetical protein BDN72DRAFT_847939 [Pluteus cervinus]|uniref:Uncharacterized protein n=1 Tax=Pluteus cervinus TaxID=181527 RepID=A0ACD3ABR3_9AGAR|nr:hypothetical protein BDN72DRAFT_847939 [Pluteus cervinus]
MRTPSSEFGVLRDLLPDGLPELSELSLIPFGSAVAPFADLMFSQCKQLRGVRISTNHINESSLDLLPTLNLDNLAFLPWHQLRTFTIQDQRIGPADFTKVFSLCTGLEICDIGLGFWRYETPLPLDVPPRHSRICAY